MRPGSWAAQQAAWGGLLTLWASAASSSAKVCSVGFVAQREGAVCSRDTLVPWFESKEETSCLLRGWLQCSLGPAFPSDTGISNNH